MKTSRFATAAAAVTIAAILILGGCTERRKQVASVLVADKAADLIADTIILEEIRAGRLSNAVELLEMDIDSNIPLLTNRALLSGGRAATNASVALKLIQRYREKYPRKREAVIPTPEKAGKK